MSDLRIIINRTLSSVTFSGGGTFSAKDEIKRLGAARWDSGAKQWQVSPYSPTKEDLLLLFPEASVSEVDEGVKSEVEQIPASGGGAVCVPISQTQQVPDGLSVGELARKVQQVLGAAFPKTVCVYGVLRAVKRHQGRVFMDISDSERPTESLSCVIWNGEEKLVLGLEQAGFKLEPDLQVMFEVEVGLSPRDGRISLRVIRIVAEYTLAKLFALREQTNQRLRDEGIFEKNKQLSLPFLPRKLGILTSAGGTVIHDFRASLDESRFGFELFWFQASVQGSGAAKQIVQGIQALQKIPGLDAILVFRGGGSVAELAVFSDYAVAKTICECPLPVCSAIGHQEDQSSTQDVSFKAFGVPKDLGRFFADLVSELRKRLQGTEEVMSSSIQSVLERSLQGLEYKAREILHHGMYHLRIVEQQFASTLLGIPRIASESVQRMRERLNGIFKPIEISLFHADELYMTRLQGTIQSVVQSIQRSLERAEDRLVHSENLLENISPEAQLKRGFSIVRKKVGSGFVLSASALQNGEEVVIEFHDATVQAMITD